MVVEVRHVLGQHRHKVAAVDDEDPVEQFAAGSSDPSFGNRICPGRPHWCAQDANPLAGEHGIETLVNLLSRSRIKILNSAARSPRSIRKLRACWACTVPKLDLDAMT